ncbi:MAG: GTPase Era [Paludibacteraceae bacterium]|nr:GTPase Era [Paludibacteraceae bacterium]MBQ6984823.1 GTPase Era [Paludibacteraceae bacterium]
MVNDQIVNKQCSQTHRSGFVNIVGNPNVGKSTLMNALVGERLSIITSKAQTTRHRIMGIVNGEDFQMVYSDTPGVLSPNYQLQRQMLEFSRSALVDADVLLYVTDVNDNPDRNADFLTKVKRICNQSGSPTSANGVHSVGRAEAQRVSVPQSGTQPAAVAEREGTRVFLIINKIDLTTQETLENLVAFWHSQLPEAEIFPISAQERFGVSQLFDAIKEALPVGPPFFPKDQLTDKSERFFVNEIIREKILQNYDKEIPYSVEVEVESFKEEDKLIRIDAVIYCERDSQKGILIGKGGSALKRVGTQARRDIEDFLQKQVFLQLYVKVDRDWRSSTSRLKHYGYDLS